MKLAFKKFDRLEDSELKLTFPYLLGASLLVTFASSATSEKDFSYFLYDLDDKLFLKGERFESLEAAKEDALNRLKVLN